MTSDQSLLFGLALGSKTPVLFVGPVPVTSPALAANSYTIVDPVPIEAVEFQVSTLGGARAERRSVAKARTSLRPAEPDSPRINRRDVNTSDLNFLSLSEQEVFQALSLDPDVISIRRETQRAVLSSPGRSYVPDFLIWIDGAEPFNPIPVEVGNQDVVPSMDRLVEAMLASQAKVGILINPEAPSKPYVHEPKSGLAVIQVGVVHPAGQDASLGRAVREARNHLVHGGEFRG
ncbi:hypothetical protein [Curtobacterium flaccumfaciens]|uniref:hypothetical protein n=1 Tax=Curtobacterium flaccumfaciens TaxID=2035 RepID=UPI00399FFA12